MHLIFTADTNLTNAISQTLGYFTSNFPSVLSAVVGIALLFWFLKLLFRSLGISGVHFGNDGDGYGMSLWMEEREEESGGGGFDIFWD